MTKAKQSSPPPQTPPRFEEALAELEQLVQRMEQGEQTLEDALADFERGITLTRFAQQQLQQAELRVEILMEKNGKQQLVPFSVDADS